MARTKTNTWNSTKHAEQQDVRVTGILNKLCVWVLDFSICIFSLIIFRFLKMNSSRHVELPSTKQKVVVSTAKQQTP